MTTTTTFIYRYTRSLRVRGC